MKTLWMLVNIVVCCAAGGCYLVEASQCAEGIPERFARSCEPGDDCGAFECLSSTVDGGPGEARCTRTCEQDSDCPTSGERWQSVCAEGLCQEIICEG